MAAMDDKPISALDYIVQETAAEIDGAIASARPCTYDTYFTLPNGHKEYGLAQPILACKTCEAACGHPVGVCQPCALSCHLEHELVDVGRRRHFRCDCGTGRTAKSVPVCGKATGGSSGSREADPGNSYGHNFANRFCSCDVPYSASLGTMLQCILCDEWYHQHHVSGCMQQCDDLDGIVCASCVAGKPYLKALVSGAAHKCCANELPPQWRAAAAAGAAEPRAEPALPAADSATGTADAADLSTAERPAAGPFRMQPWVACLTCSSGADDGTGVCLACAAACHKGHVLTKPRVSVFACDCRELLEGKGSNESSAATTPASCCGLQQMNEEAAAPVSAPNGPAWCAGKPSDLHGTSASGTDTSTVTSPETPSIFFNSWEDELMPLLCCCTACFQRYQQDGVLALFLQPPDLLGTEPALAEEAPDAVAAVGGTAAPTASQPTTAPAMTGKRRRDLDPSSLVGGLSGSAIASLVPGLPSGFKTSYEQGLEAVSQLPPAMQLDAYHAYSDMRNALFDMLRREASRQRPAAASDAGDGSASTTDSAVVITKEMVETMLSDLMAAKANKRARRE